MITRPRSRFCFARRLVVRVRRYLANWIHDYLRAWAGSRFVRLIIHMVPDLWCLASRHIRTREVQGFLVALVQRFRDVCRRGPFLARSVEGDACFEVFGVPVRFEKPSQIADRFSEIAGYIGTFGVLDDRDGLFHTFQQGRIRIRSRDPEDLALDYGLDPTKAEQVLSAWCTDWAFMTFHHPTGPLVFGYHAHLSDNPDDAVSRANWQVAESIIFDDAPDREMIRVWPTDLQRFFDFGYTYLDSGLDDITPETAVILADGAPWIRADLLDDFVSALADYPILCDGTYSELCHEIETEALTRWVFDELADLIGDERDDLRETWEMLEDDAKAEHWQCARGQASFPCWVDQGELQVDFPNILPHIIDRLDAKDAGSEMAPEHAPS